MSARTTFRAQLLGSFLMAMVCLGGCGQSSEEATPTSDKPYVKVLLGQDNYEKAAPQLATGKKLKFKGEFAESEGNKVVIHIAELYDGDQPAIQAADLTKDFLTDRAAAETKYEITEFGENAMIVEGVVSETSPENFSVCLGGHEG